MQLLKNIESRPPRFPPAVSPACHALMAALLQRDPMQRLCFEDFFLHPFLVTSQPYLVDKQAAIAARIGSLT